MRAGWTEQGRPPPEIAVIAANDADAGAAVVSYLQLAIAIDRLHQR